MTTSQLLDDVLDRLSFDNLEQDAVKEAATNHGIDIDDEEDFVSNFNVICSDLGYEAYDEILEAIDTEVIYYDQAMDYIRERQAYSGWGEYDAYIGHINGIMDVCFGELMTEIDEIGIYNLVGQYYYDNYL